MERCTSGVLAGLTATMVLSILMLLKGVMEVMPDLDVIAMPAGMAGADAVMGWIAHVVIGAVLGASLAGLRQRKTSPV